MKYTSHVPVSTVVNMNCLHMFVKAVFLQAVSRRCFFWIWFASIAGIFARSCMGLNSAFFVSGHVRLVASIPHGVVSQVIWDWGRRGFDSSWFFAFVVSS